MSVVDTTPKLRFLEVLFYGLQRWSARADLAVVQKYWRRHWRGLHGHRLRNNLWVLLAGPVRSPRGAIHRVSGVPELRVLHSVSLSLQCVIVLTSSCGPRLDHGKKAMGYASDEGANFWKEELMGAHHGSNMVTSSSAAVNTLVQESEIFSPVHYRSPCRVACCLIAP